MSSISSTSSSTSSMLAAMSGNRVTGLMSGLDTDELVKNMSATTRSKIATTQQKVTKAQWEQEALRALTTSLLEFQNKYTSYSSATNLRSNAFFGQNNITPAGAFSDFVKASGSGSNAGNVSIVGVSQLAKVASMVSGSISDGVLKGGKISEQADASVLAGESITFEYGGESYQVTFDAGKEYTNMDDIAKVIQEQLIDKIGNDEITVQAENNELVFKTGGQTIKVDSVSSDIASVLKIQKGDEINVEKRYSVDLDKAQEKQDLNKYLKGKSFTFDYNGTSKTIQFTAKDLEGIENTTDGIAQAFQKKMNEAFGVGRIEVKANDAGGLEFRTTKPTMAGADPVYDTTSVLTLTGGDAVGLKALNLVKGESTHLKTNAAWKEAGIDFSRLSQDAGGNNIGTVDMIKDSNIYIKDNITDEIYTIEVTDDMTIDDIIKEINNKEGLNVKAGYLSGSDQLTLTSTQEGASGNFSIVAGNNGLSLGEALFGTKDAVGEDAEFFVDYGDGAEPVKMSRSSNTFDLNGMDVTISGTFNVGEDGQYIDKNAAVKFEAAANVDKITTAVKEMVEAYNAILETANKMVREKPDRSYSPLSEDQKEDMEDDEIEDWTKKAKAGILFNDADLRMFTDEISTLFGGSGEIIKALEDMGITTSSKYSENGKLVFDEDKFRAAVEADPSKVEKIFAGENGIMAGVQKTFDKYAKVEGATKGIFVQRAGHEDSALSMLDNELKNEIDEYEEYIEKLKEKLQKEVEKYYNMFASLESYISNMNAQSSMFFSMGS